jgi:hypothetical protein
MAPPVFKLDLIWSMRSTNFCGEQRHADFLPEDSERCLRTILEKAPVALHSRYRPGAEQASYCRSASAIRQTSGAGGIAYASGRCKLNDKPVRRLRGEGHRGHRDKRGDNKATYELPPNVRYCTGR